MRLKDLLSMAQVRPGAKYIAFRCYDGYDVGIPLERRLLEGTILAYDMNLAPLTSGREMVGLMMLEKLLITL